MLAGLASGLLALLSFRLAGEDAAAKKCEGSKKKCGGKCVDTSKDPRNCGKCGKRCQVNAICKSGKCRCAQAKCGNRGLSCCPKRDLLVCAGSPANAPDGRFMDPNTCDSITSCPADQQCVGPEFQACCPARSTCDTSTGTCLRK
jgi:hypothetical protein